MASTGITDSGAGIIARTEAQLDRIADHADEFKAFITTTPETVCARAAEIDRALAAGGWPGLLAGVTVAVKDNVDTAGVRTTNGAKFFADHVPNADATVVKRLRAAGAVIVGKANLHEFAFGATTQNPHWGSCRNPWDTGRVPGGSSGGSGAAVAADLCDAALGSDTGGSVRIPASLCGVTGLRPTVGRISNHGTFPVSPPLDTIGPLARDARDVARLFAALSGYDPADPLSEDHPLENFLPTVDDGIAGLRIGVPENFYFDDLDPGVADAVAKALDALAGAGAEIRPVRVPGAEEAQERSAFTVVIADAAALHRERMEREPETFGADVLGRLSLGVAVDGRAYADAMRWREGWRAGVRALFTEVDIVATPTTPHPAPSVADAADTVEATRGLSRFTFGWSFAGVPALSLPCGFAADGLPVGLQLVAPWWREPALFRAGVAYQARTDWHTRRPPASNA